jgi:predicted TIM-barrel fold metal-dependent hydrolase
MPLANWIQTLKEVVAMRPMEEQRKLFHDNAEAFYGLS